MWRFLLIYFILCVIIWKLIKLYILPVGPRRSVLQEMDLVVITNSKCQEKYNKTSINITSDMLCATAHGKYTCFVSCSYILRNIKLYIKHIMLPKSFNLRKNKSIGSLYKTAIYFF